MADPVRERLDDPQVFLPEVWATHARFNPAKPAVVCGSVTRNWGDFDRNMNKVANQLVARGIGRGDKVAVLMGNCVEILEIIFGITRAGACVVPLSGLLTADQVAILVDDCDAVALFCSAAYRGKVDAVRDRLPKLRADCCWAFDFTGPGWTEFAAFIAGADDSFPKVSYRLDDPFNIIYSSGTTGLPKGIVQSHRARLHWSYSNAIEMRFHDQARALTTTALYSNGTWLMILPVLFTGGTLYVLPEFTPLGFLETVQRQRITHTFMVPTQFIVTLAEPALDQFDLSSIEAILSAGSPLRPDTKAEALARLTSNLYCLYGFSEGFATIAKPHAHAAKPDSVGLPVLGFELMIVDEAGNELPPGEAGEVAGYGGGLMLGYHRRPELTAASIVRDRRGRTFFRSGDIGRLDADGYLYIVDRKKDMIISGGFNVFPTDIETVLGEHAAVMDVTVIGIPDAKWGETPLALVIPRPGANGAVDAEAIRTWANARLAKHQRLAAVEFRDEFPRNALGKVLKRLLRDPYWPPRG